jgi:hypothetical protein
MPYSFFHRQPSFTQYGPQAGGQQPVAQRPIQPTTPQPPASNWQQYNQAVGQAQQPDSGMLAGLLPQGQSGGQLTSNPSYGAAINGILQQGQQNSGMGASLNNLAGGLLAPPVTPQGVLQTARSNIPFGPPAPAGSRRLRYG